MIGSNPPAPATSPPTASLASRQERGTLSEDQFKSRLDACLAERRGKLLGEARGWLHGTEIDNHDEAEDCLQEAVVRALRYQSSYIETVPMEVWLRQIIRNVCTTHKQKLCRHRTLSLDERLSGQPLCHGKAEQGKVSDHLGAEDPSHYAEAGGCNPSAEVDWLREVDKAVARANAQRLLTQVSREDQELLETVYLKEDDRAKIAAARGWTPRQLSRVLERLRDKLRKQHPDLHHDFIPGVG